MALILGGYALALESFGMIEVTNRKERMVEEGWICLRCVYRLRVKRLDLIILSEHDC
jgi:hypothetical protein